MAQEKMIDVSDWQGTIDWAKISASGVKVAGIKITEGIDYEDPRAEANVAEAKEHGIHVIPYHYARPDHHSTPEAEVAWFKQIATKLGIGNERPALDIEVGSGDLSDYAIGFLNGVGHDCYIYSNPNFIAEHLTHVPDSHPLWIAEYGVKSPTLHQWKSYAIWQYDDKGRVDGISTDVDMNYFVVVDVAVKVPSGTPYIGEKYQRTGELVKEFQSAFNDVVDKIGYHKIAVDGIVGPITEGAIKALQNHGHIKVDGIYGPETAKVLEGLIK